jgi:hypothetical protein
LETPQQIAGMATTKKEPSRPGEKGMGAKNGGEILPTQRKNARNWEKDLQFCCKESLISAQLTPFLGNHT